MSRCNPDATRRVKNGEMCRVDSWGLPNIRDTFLGVPIVRVIIFLVYIGVPPFRETTSSGLRVWGLWVLVGSLAAFVSNIMGLLWYIMGILWYILVYDSILS